MAPGALDLEVEADLRLDTAEVIRALRLEVEQALGGLAVDAACPALGRGAGSGCSWPDMDSTIIGCECLDELADFARVKDKVAAITERAMRGELDFDGGPAPSGSEPCCRRACL